MDMKGHTATVSQLLGFQRPTNYHQILFVYYQPAAQHIQYVSQVPSGKGMLLPFQHIGVASHMSSRPRANEVINPLEELVKMMKAEFPDLKGLRVNRWGRRPHEIHLLEGDR